jgi:hypothetical protein
MNEYVNSIGKPSDSPSKPSRKKRFREPPAPTADTSLPSRHLPPTSTSTSTERTISSTAQPPHHAHIRSRYECPLSYQGSCSRTVDLVRSEKKQSSAASTVHYPASSERTFALSKDPMQTRQRGKAANLGCGHLRPILSCPTIPAG